MVLYDGMRKMKILVCLMILVILVIPINATQINEKLGPYSINVSIPNNCKTTVTIVNSETYEGIKNQEYNLEISDKKTNTPVAEIHIIHFDSMVNVDNCNTIGIQETLEETDTYSEIEHYNRIIDGIPGHLYKGTAINKNFDDCYMFGYALNYQNIVGGTSIMAWNNDTSEILDTLHIDVI